MTMLLLLIAAITLLSICNAFTPSSILSPSSISQRRITNNGVVDSNINTILTSSSSTTTQLKMAQRMTPTRKTRKEDSFDRGQNDDKEEEGTFSCAAWLCALCGVRRCSIVYAHILCSFFIYKNHLNNSPQSTIKPYQQQPHNTYNK